MEAQGNHTEFTRTVTGSTVANGGAGFQDIPPYAPSHDCAPITDQVPLFADPYGTLRVQGTRVTLNSIVTAFRAGATAEEISFKDHL
jgi:hypothetical protein